MLVVGVKTPVENFALFLFKYLLFRFTRSVRFLSLCCFLLVLVLVNFVTRIWSCLGWSLKYKQTVCEIRQHGDVAWFPLSINYSAPSAAIFYFYYFFFMVEYDLQKSRSANTLVLPQIQQMLRVHFKWLYLKCCSFGNIVHDVAPYVAKAHTVKMADHEFLRKKKQ